MFQLMLEFKARLDLKNRQGLTPLTLAAKLARKEVKFLRGINFYVTVDTRI